MAPSDTKGLVRVLVYGTLKSRQYNNDLMQRAGARFVGFDYIAGSFKLVDLGAFPAAYFIEPSATKGGFPNNHIYGEIWAVPSEMIAELDYMEGHPNFYKRVKLWSQRLNLRVWTYFMEAKYHTDHAVLLPKGIWQPSSEELQFWNEYDESKTAHV